MPYPIADAQILEISGTHARAFAHAQFTSNVDRLGHGEWQWSAWLDAKGRVRNLFALLLAGETRLLAWLPRGDAATMAAALLPFVFRSKVSLQPQSDYGLFEAAETAQPSTPDDIEHWILDLPGIPPRRAALVNGAAVDSIDSARLDAWTREDIACGLAWICAENSGEFTPQALGLERMAAISLTKGCYPGQEIVARLHYRGGNKRGCMRLHIDDEIVPLPGTEIKIETNPAAIGRILYAVRDESAGCEALAVLPLDLPERASLLLSTGAATRRLPFSNGTA